MSKADLDIIAEQFMKVKDILDLGYEADRIAAQQRQLSARMEQISLTVGAMSDDALDFVILVESAELPAGHPFVSLASALQHYCAKL